MSKNIVGVLFAGLLMFLLNLSIAIAQVGTISIQAKQQTVYTVAYLSFAVIALLGIIIFLLRYLLMPKPSARHRPAVQRKQEEPVVLQPFYDKEQIRKEREQRIQERKREVVLGHLTEDEQQVIEILKRRDGVCEQGTLKVITDFSKAKLSELLTELETRKIVIKKKKGRKNLIILAEA